MHVPRIRFRHVSIAPSEAPDETPKTTVKDPIATPQRFNTWTRQIIIILAEKRKDSHSSPFLFVRSKDTVPRFANYYLQYLSRCPGGQESTLFRALSSIRLEVMKLILSCCVLWCYGEKWPTCKNSKTHIVDPPGRRAWSTTLTSCKRQSIDSNGHGFLRSRPLTISICRTQIITSILTGWNTTHCSSNYASNEKSANNQGADSAKISSGKPLMSPLCRKGIATKYFSLCTTENAARDSTAFMRSLPL